MSHFNIDVKQVNLFDKFCSHNNNYTGCYQCRSASPLQLVVADYTINSFGVDCYYTFVVNTLYNNVAPTLINTVQNNVLQLNGNCQSQVTLTYDIHRANTMATIDSGAGISCLGKQLFQLLFPESKLKMTPTKYSLRGAGGNQLAALGEIYLGCTIATIKHSISFVVIDDSECLLIGWPDIKRYQMVINSSRNSVLVGGLYCDRLLSNYPRKSISIRLEVISFPDIYYHGTAIKIMVRPLFNQNNIILLTQ